MPGGAATPVGAGVVLEWSGAVTQYTVACLRLRLRGRALFRARACVRVRFRARSRAFSCAWAKTLRVCMHALGVSARACGVRARARRRLPATRPKLSGYTCGRRRAVPGCLYVRSAEKVPPRVSLRVRCVGGAERRLGGAQ